MITNETVRANILKYCAEQIGTTENPKGSNKTIYGKWFGFDGVAWCCMFVCWIFVRQAGVKLNVNKNDKGFAHTRYIIEYAIKHNLFTDNPKPGDIVMLDFKKDTWIDHIGIFKEFVPGTKSAMIYEGNTSSDAKGSQDNGDGVYLKKREPKFIHKYINVDHFIEIYQKSLKS